jgi:hypothetical protein
MVWGSVLNFGMRNTTKQAAKQAGRETMRQTGRNIKAGSLKELRRGRALLNSPRKIIPKGRFKLLKYAGGIAGTSLMLGLASMTITSLWQGIVTAGQTIMNFDFNMTDAAIDDMAKRGRDALYGVVGGALGTSLGWLACGAVPGAMIAAINPGVGAAIWGKKNKDTGKWEDGEFTEEMKEEILQAMAMMAYGAWRLTMRTVVGDAFKSLRRWIKEGDNPVSGTIKNYLVGRMGQEAFDDWGIKQKQPWTISAKIQEKIEAIPDEQMKEFVEEFVEEFGESCLEASFQITNSIDSHYAAEKLKNRTQMRQVELVIEEA